MKRFLTVLLCAAVLGALPVWAEEDPLTALAREELTALGYDLTGCEAACEGSKVIFTGAEETDRIAVWTEVPQEGEPYLAAFLARGFGGEKTAGYRTSALSRYITGLSPLMVTHTVGDLDGDGKVTTTDARLVLQISLLKNSSFHQSLGELEDPEAAEALAFVNVDGNRFITTTDARLILQYSVGKIDVFPKNG